MRIVDFETRHIEEARGIALENYIEETERVAALPKLTEVPEPAYFAENGLGVAAFDGEKCSAFWAALNRGKMRLTRLLWVRFHPFTLTVRSRIIVV